MSRLNNIIFSIIEEQNILKTTKTKPIVNAIKNRFPISFYYSGPRKPSKDSVKAGKRIDAEAVALGLSKRGNLVMRAWVQPPSVSKKGFTKSGWRTFMISRMGNVEIHNEKTFDTKRPQYHEGSDGALTVTYVTSDWTKAPEKIEPEPEKVQIQKPEPVTPPIQQPTRPIQKPEPVNPSIQQPIQKVEPTVIPPKSINKPVKTVQPVPEPKKEVNPIKKELPQPKPKDKPSPTPENPNNVIKENIRKRIKYLMLS